MNKNSNTVKKEIQHLCPLNWPQDNSRDKNPNCFKLNLSTWDMFKSGQGVLQTLHSWLVFCILYFAHISISTIKKIIQSTSRLT